MYKPLGFVKHRSSFLQRFLVQRRHVHRTSDTWDVETALKKSVRMEDKGYALRGPAQKLWQTSEMVEMTMTQDHRLNLAQVYIQWVGVVKETRRRYARVHEHDVFLRVCADLE
jgi:hypothetical protein